MWVTRIQMGINLDSIGNHLQIGSVNGEMGELDSSGMFLEKRGDEH